jgi:hypothetical protein
MKKEFLLTVVLVIVLFACNQKPQESTENEKKIETVLPELTGNDTTFSDQHYEIASEAIATLKSKDYKKLESYMVTEFLPPQGFEKVDFIVSIADHIQDKGVPSKDDVRLRIGRNTYKGEKIPFKTYDFPFYEVSGKDTVAKSTVVISFADGIQKNKIANLSFKDY